MESPASVSFKVRAAVLWRVEQTARRLSVERLVGYSVWQVTGGYEARSADQPGPKGTAVLVASYEAPEAPATEPATDPAADGAGARPGTEGQPGPDGKTGDDPPPQAEPGSTETAPPPVTPPSPPPPGAGTRSSGRKADRR